MNALFGPAVAAQCNYGKRVFDNAELWPDPAAGKLILKIIVQKPGVLLKEIRTIPLKIFGYQPLPLLSQRIGCVDMGMSIDGVGIRQCMISSDVWIKRTSALRFQKATAMPGMNSGEFPKPPIFATLRCFYARRNSFYKIVILRSHKFTKMLFAEKSGKAYSTSTINRFQILVAQPLRGAQPILGYGRVISI